MILIKTNAKHSIPQSSSSYVPSLTTLPHFQKIWLINQTATFFLPHLTGWVWKYYVYLVQHSVLQQNVARCQDAYAGCGNYDCDSWTSPIHPNMFRAMQNPSTGLPQPSTAQCCLLQLMSCWNIVYIKKIWFDIFPSPQLFSTSHITEKNEVKWPTPFFVVNKYYTSPYWKWFTEVMLSTQM